MEVSLADTRRYSWIAEWVHNTLQYCVYSGPNDAETAIFLVSQNENLDVLMALIISSTLQQQHHKGVALLAKYCDADCSPEWLHISEPAGGELVSCEVFRSTASALQTLERYDHRVVLELGHCLADVEGLGAQATCFDHVQLCICVEDEHASEAADATETAESVALHCPLTGETLRCRRKSSHTAMFETGFGPTLTACDNAYTSQLSELFLEIVPVPASMKHAKLVFDYANRTIKDGEPKIDEENLIVRFPHQRNQMLPTKQVETSGSQHVAEKELGKVSKMQVWTTAGPGASIDYLMVVFRLSAQDPLIFLELCPVLRQKLTYIEQSGDTRKAELRPLLLAVAAKIAVYAAFLHFHWIDSKAVIRIVSELCRVLVVVDELNSAKYINAHFIRLLPDQPELWAIQGRCAMQEQNTEVARAAFTRVLELRPNDAEAAMCLRKFDNQLKLEREHDPPHDSPEALPTNDEHSPKSTGAWAKLMYLANKKAHKDEGHVLLESNVKLSDSLVWATQRRYYENKGVDAWGNGDEHRVDVVPFYVTSNLRIARTYALLIYQYYVDLLKAKKLDYDDGVFVIETGAGHGKFSYLFIQVLKELWQQTPALNGVQCTLIVTDFTDRNLEAIESRPEFTLLIEEGWVDLAVFDLASTSPELHLRHSGRRISPTHQTSNPLSVVMNYVLDSLPTDVYKVGEDRTILEGRVTTYSTQQAEPDPTSPEIVSRLRRVWQYTKPEVEQLYEDEAINQVIVDYAGMLNIGSVFTIPISGILAIRRMQAWVRGGQLAVLIADKSYNRLELLQQKNHPMLAMHGSLSIMVNLHSVGRILELTGNGNNMVLHSGHRCSVLDVSMACLQIQPEVLNSTQIIFHQHLSAIGLTDIFVLRDHIEDVVRSRAQRSRPEETRISVPLVSLKTVYLVYKLSGWDIDVLWQFVESITGGIPHTRDEILVALSLTLKEGMLGYIPYFDPKQEVKLAYEQVQHALQAHLGSLR